jgi:hypothetical protein
MSSQVTEVLPTIAVASQFSRTPGGRYYSDGPDTGEKFREEFLIPALQAHQSILIELDGTRGYPSSFLEEAFGGTVRRLRMSADEFFRRVKFKSAGDFQIYVDDIHYHVKKAANGLKL